MKCIEEDAVTAAAEDGGRKSYCGIPKKCIQYSYRFQVVAIFFMGFGCQKVCILAWNVKLHKKYFKFHCAKHSDKPLKA